MPSQVNYKQAFLLVCILALCSCKTDQSRSNNPYATLNEVGTSSAWIQLQNEIKETKVVWPNAVDVWIDESLEIYGGSRELNLRDLQVLWREIEAKGVSPFTELELKAYDDAAKRLASFETHPSLEEGHRLLERSITNFPDSRTLGEVPHDRNAQFNLLHAIFVRAELNTPKDKAWNPEWLYLQGRALQIIKRGGEEELRDFIIETKGRSPYARPALEALTEILRQEMDPRDSREKLQPPADLLKLVEDAERKK